VQRLLTSGPGGGWPARFYVGLAHVFVHMCLHEKGKPSGGESWWRPNHMVGRPRG
jgi:hypothetical protein